MPYPFTDSDITIRNAYTSLAIVAPVDLQTLCDAAGIRVRYQDAESASYPERRRIVLDVNQDRLTQREDWAHELAHVLLHCGPQLSLPTLFSDLQERQAHTLELYLLVPTHLLIPYLKNLQPRIDTEAIGSITRHFDVSVAFAKRRWQKLQSQIEAHRRQAELSMVMEAMPQYGRDYDSRLTIGNTEYFYRNGGVVFQRRAVQE